MNMDGTGDPLVQDEANFKAGLAAAMAGVIVTDVGASDAMVELYEDVAVSVGDERKLAIAACRAQYRAEVARAQVLGSAT